MRMNGRFFVAGGLLLSLLAGSLPASAQETDSAPIPARVRHFEGTVTVQRAQAGETSAALVNLPLDAGDRIWTDSSGRAEVMLGDGTLIWLSAQTTLDIVALARSGTLEDSILRMWNGSLIVERSLSTTAGSRIRFDIPDAVVSVPAGSSVRLDVDDERNAWLSVYQGEAQMDAGGISEIVAAGQRTFVQPGTAPAESVAFNTAEQDDFATWQSSRWLAVAAPQRQTETRDYVPAEVRPYAGELAANGSWFYHSDFGSWAWRPTVAVGWSPYRHGRWVFGFGGWSWVSYSSWGWATSHWGRWHHLPAQGWVWFPGRVYAPSWVSWYVSGGWVGWCPIGFWGRPFVSFSLWFGGHYGYGYGYHGRHHYNYPGYGYGGGSGGKAVNRLGYARGDTAAVPTQSGDGWSFVQGAKFGRTAGGDIVTSRTDLAKAAPTSSVSFSGPLKARNPQSLTTGSSGPGRGATLGGGKATTARLSPGRGVTPRGAGGNALNGPGRGSVQGKDTGRSIPVRPRIDTSGGGTTAGPDKGGVRAVPVRPRAGDGSGTQTGPSKAPVRSVPVRPRAGDGNAGRVQPKSGTRAVPVRPRSTDGGRATVPPKSPTRSAPVRPRSQDVGGAKPGASGSGGRAVIPRATPPSYGSTGNRLVRPRGSGPSSYRPPSVQPRSSGFGTYRPPTVQPRSFTGGRPASPPSFTRSPSRPGGYATPRSPVRVSPRMPGRSTPFRSAAPRSFSSGSGSRGSFSPGRSSGGRSSGGSRGAVRRSGGKRR